MRGSGAIAKAVTHGQERWRYSWYDANGHRRSLLFRTRADALDEQRRQVRAGTFDHKRQVVADGITSRMTLAAYADRWKQEYPIAHKLKIRTRESYEATLRLHILPVRAGSRTLGELPVRDALTFDRLRTLLVEKRAQDRLRDNSLRIIIATLRALCGSAVSDRLLTQDPTAGLRKEIRLTLPTGRRRGERIRAFSQPQLEQFLVVARETSELWDLYVVLANAAPRIGEGIALHSDDIYVDPAGQRHTLRLSRQLDDRGRLGDSTKSGSDRTVALTAGALTALRARMKMRAEWKLRYRWPEMPLWLFTTRSGRPYSQRNVRRDMARVLARAGLPAEHSPHDFRHTFASLHLTAGRPVKWVQEQLGHATAALTTDLYGKWIPTELAAPDLATGLRER